MKGSLYGTEVPIHQQSNMAFLEGRTQKHGTGANARLLVQSLIHCICILVLSVLETNTFLYLSKASIGSGCSPTKKCRKRDHETRCIYRHHRLAIYQF